MNTEPTRGLSELAEALLAVLQREQRDGLVRMTFAQLGAEVDRGVRTVQDGVAELLRAEPPLLKKQAVRGRANTYRLLIESPEPAILEAVMAIAEAADRDPRAPANPGKPTPAASAATPATDPGSTGNPAPPYTPSSSSSDRRPPPAPPETPAAAPDAPAAAWLRALRVDPTPELLEDIADLELAQSDWFRPQLEVHAPRIAGLRADGMCPPSYVVTVLESAKRMHPASDRAPHRPEARVSRRVIGWLRTALDRAEERLP